MTKLYKKMALELDQIKQQNFQFSQVEYMCKVLMTTVMVKVYKFDRSTCLH
jgi:hypothetical protein